MARYFAWVLAALLVLPAFGGAAQQQASGRGADDKKPGSPPRWWVEPKMRAELGITDQQSAAVEQVWQTSIPKLRELRQRLDTMESTLSDMIRDATDEGSVLAQIEKTESVRAEANKTRTLMLYRMNRVLTPDQRVKLKVLWDRIEAQRRATAPDHRRH
jgi:Spy/CpxP family protein refolding chaperone